MALTGLKIQKLLPKTNCKECGSNTCLAFAMKLAAKKADLSECPYASDEAKEILGAAAAPPVRSVSFGEKKELTVGGETVLYRHEKTFVHGTLLAVNVSDSESDEKIDEILRAVDEYRLERVGEVFQVDMVAVTQKSDDPKRFREVATRAWERTGRPVIAISSQGHALEDVAVALKGTHGLLAGADAESAVALQAACQENGHALAVTGEDLDSLVQTTRKLKNNGFHDIVLRYNTFSLAEQFQTNSIGRQAAIRRNLVPLGYPSLKIIESEDGLDVISHGATEILKYGGIVVLPEFDPAILSSLLTLRLNIFTDPQKPIQVEPKLYEIGEPTKDSPVFVTTNFSLTYFIVSGEIENAGISAWLVVPECEGMSVLTSWAAGKFSGATIGKFCQEIELEKRVDSRKIIIPGYISQVSGELEEALPGWDVIVGPQEAADLESFVKAHLR